MRLFVSSAFEPAFAANLKAVSDYARGNAGRDAVRWVAPEAFHLTYAFLGELGAPGAEAAVKGIDEALAAARAFTIVSGGFGCFPSQRRPSVLWLGIAEGSAELRELARRLAEALAANGVFFEDRFEPHVTLGRVKGPLPEGFFRRAADYAAVHKAASRVSSVELTESRLTPDGPVYRQVYSRRLL